MRCRARTQTQQCGVSTTEKTGTALQSILTNADVLWTSVVAVDSPARLAAGTAGSDAGMDPS